MTRCRVINDEMATQQTAKILQPKSDEKMLVDMLN